MDDLDLEAAQAQETAEPEPEPVVEEQAEAPEPELPEAEPSWLDESAEEPPHQQWQPEYTQQQQPQQTQPQKASGNLLESFVNDPEGTLDRLVNERMAQYLGPMAYQLQNTQATSQRFIRAQAENAIQQTRKAIEQGYKDILNKDEAFRAHKGVRSRVENAMKGMYQDAARAASQGDISRLQQLSNPVFLDTMLYMAKRIEGYKPRAVGSYEPKGATVESTKSKQRAQSVSIDPDTESAIRDRLGSEYLERYKKAMAGGSADIEFS